MHKKSNISKDQARCPFYLPYVLHFFCIFMVVFLFVTSVHAEPKLESVSQTLFEAGKPHEVRLNGTGFDEDTQVSMYLEVGNKQNIIGSWLPAGEYLKGPQSVFVDGKYAYVADGIGGLAIIDVSDPSAPEKKGALDTGGYALDVTVSGDTAYVADRNCGLVIIDVGDPSAPEKKGTLGTSRSTQGVAVSGSTAYVADGTGGLVIIDVGDPSAPQRKGSLDTGGNALDVTVSRDTAYVANCSGGLVIIDVSDPSAPEGIGSLDTGGDARGVTVSGDTAYVADLYGGLVIIDVSDPSAPERKGSFVTGGSAYGVTVSGDTAYVADAFGALFIIDVSDPSAPERKGALYTGGDARGIMVSGDMAYVADVDGGLVIIDVSDPSVPEKKGSLNKGGIVLDVTVSGNIAYVTDEGCGLVIIDVSDPSAPEEIGSLDTGGNACGVTVSGDTAYVVAGYGGMVIIDVSDPSAPERTGFFDTGGYARGVTVFGDTAYVANWYGGLVIIDVSDPSEPEKKGSFVTGGEACGITVYGDTACVADGYGGLVIIDVSDPSAPERKGSFDTGGNACGVTVSGDTAYVANGNGGLVIIDVSDPSAPERKGAFDTGIGYAWDVTVSGDTAYVTDWYGSLVIVDVSDPSTPESKGAFETGGNAWGVTVSGDTAYVANGIAGLVIIDVSDPSAPEGKGSLDTGYASGVTVSGDTAYVADGHASLVIINVSDPSAPERKGSLDTGVGYAWSVTVSGDTAYMANRWDGLVIIDVSDPSAPEKIGSLDTDGDAMDVTVSGDMAYVADEDGGLVIIDVSDPSAPEKKGSLDTGGNAECVTVSGDTAYVAAGYGGLVIIDVSDPSAPARKGSLDTRGGCGYARGVTVSGDTAYVAVWGVGLVVVDVSDPSAPEEIGSFDTGGNAECVTVSGDTAYVGTRDGLTIIHPIPVVTKLSSELKSENNILVRLPETEFAGDYTVKVSSKNKESYELPGAITFTDKISVQKAIIVSGGNPVSSENKIREETDAAAGRAFEALRLQGYAENDILYLGPAENTAGQTITKENLKNAITEWSKQDEESGNPTTELLIFFVGHGREGAFILSDSEEVSAEKLNEWLNELHDSVSELEKVIFVYDSCQSGSFIEELTPPDGKERIVITGTQSDQAAYFLGDGAFSFSYRFWDEILNGQTLGTAFESAKDLMADFQDAQVKADNVLTEISEMKIRRGYVRNTFRPHIFFTEVPESAETDETGKVFTLRGETFATIRAKIQYHRDGSEMQRVWAVIQPPDFNPQSESPDVPVTDLPVIDLEYKGNATYEGIHKDFAKAGYYEITVFARNRDELTGEPYQFIIRQEVGVQIDSIADPQNLGDETSATIWANISAVADDVRIESVEAVITRPDGSQESEPITLAGTGNGFFSKDHTGFEQDGLYHIKITAQTEDGYEFDKTTVFAKPSASPMASEADKFEPNDTLEQANAIIVGGGTDKSVEINGEEQEKTQRHYFYKSGDQDWIKFYALKDEAFKIRITPSQFCDVEFAICDSDGENIFPDPENTEDTVNNGGFDKEEPLYWTCKEEGTYYLKITNAAPAIFGSEVHYDVEIYKPIGPIFSFVVGKITDGDGIPIPNAVVTTDKGETYSLKNGVFAMIHPPGNDFEMTVTYSGEQKTITFSVTEGQNTDPQIITFGTPTPEPPPAPDRQPSVSIISPDSDVTITLGEPVNFRASVSGGNAPFRYFWDFDGGADNSTEKNPGDISFNQEGKYTVKVTVTDADGDKDSASVTVTVIIPELTAKILSPQDGTEINSGTSINLQGKGSGGTRPYTFSWTKNGEEISTENPASVTFEAPGTYNIRLIVTDKYKTTSEASISIIVKETGSGIENTQPKASIIIPAGPITISAGTSPDFRAKVEDGNHPLKYSWNFGNGQTSSLLEPETPIIFETAGEYNVTFTVTDSDNETDSASVTVTVKSRPEKPKTLPITENDSATDVPLMPTLRTSGFVHLSPGYFHKQTRWQIATDPDFSQLVSDVTTETHLEEFFVPHLILDHDTDYYWRVQFIDNGNNESEWSEAAEFRTLSDPDYDKNADGIPDNQEPDEAQLSDLSPDAKWILTADSKSVIGIAPLDDEAVVTALQSLSPNDDSITSRSEKIPLGLIAFKIALNNSADTVNVTVYLPESVSDNTRWYKYDTVSGWYDFSSHAEFSEDRKSVRLTLQDGGTGDADGVKNGFIVDPSGPVTFETDPTSSDSVSIEFSAPSGDAGDGGCFITTALNSSD